MPTLSPLPLKVLIDSGCTRSFIDKNLLNINSSCKAVLLPKPLTLRLFDGSVAPSGPITLYTDLDFQVPGLAPETFRFLATDLDSSVSLALGYDWLLQRNPDINWVTGSIVPRQALSDAPALTPCYSDMSADAAAVVAADIPPTLVSDSPKIDVRIIGAAAFARLAHQSPICIGSMTSSIADEVAASTSNSQDPNLTDLGEELSHIPSCYRDYADVFSKAKADILPPQ